MCLRERVCIRIMCVKMNGANRKVVERHAIDKYFFLILRAYVWCVIVSKYIINIIYGYVIICISSVELERKKKCFDTNFA